MRRTSSLLGLFALAASASLPRELDPLRPLEPDEDDDGPRLAFDAPPISVRVHRDDLTAAPPIRRDEPRPPRPRPGAERKSRGIEARPDKKQARKAERAARRKSRGRR